MPRGSNVHKEKERTGVGASIARGQKREETANCLKSIIESE